MLLTVNMPKRKKSNQNVNLLAEILKSRHKKSAKRLQRKHPVAVQYLRSKNIEPGKIRQQAAKLLTSGAIAGSLLLAAPQVGVVQQIQTAIEQNMPNSDINQKLVNDLAMVLPDQVQTLSPDQEKKISNIFQKTFGIKSSAVISGVKLNQSYGYMGAEQHLPRFPGDTAMQHELSTKGITPGLGAWGYFAYSKYSMTHEAIENEKYYVAVQTLYMPEWNSKLNFLIKWFKYRKVIVVNPENGKAVVADIADSGPAQWTGKHFGGSPEVMALLNLNVGKQKGPVVVFFVDDPKGEVPLGPIDYNFINPNNNVIKLN
jgi:hypothetical protein